MFAVERWYEYQEDYKKYGIDLRPKENTKARKNRTKNDNSLKVTSADRIRLLSLTIFVGVLGLIVIVSTAFAASIKYDINRIIVANDELSNEIGTLNVELMEATNIETIEEKAVSQLGMVYPQQGEYVFVNTSVTPEADFGLVMKEQAFN
ncbi:MAG: cell division protein FtsL [Clostridia bacterium]|nr:cell division protein FtsL [Clostridia bacterium]